MPRRQLQTRLHLRAPIGAVWAALLELCSEGDGRSDLRLRPWRGGAPRAGERAWLGLALFDVPLRVPVRLESTSEYRLSWVGGPPGLVRGRHYLELRELEGATELLHGEDFSGLALPLLWPALEPELGRLYARINRALADRLELP